MIDLDDPANHPSHNREVQEALSRVHGHDVVRVLQLSTGQYAIYDYTGTLAGFTDTLDVWPPPCLGPRTPIDLKSLGII